MRYIRLLFRLAATLAAVFLCASALLWNAPGREVDENVLSGYAASSPATPRWTSYADFAVWYADELRQGRAGNSVQFGAPVHELIAERAGLTLETAAKGLAAAWILSISASVLAHFWPFAGRAALAAGSLTFCLPSAFLVLCLLFAGASPWVGLTICVWPRIHAYLEAFLERARRRTHVVALMTQGAGPWRVQWDAVWRPLVPQLLGLAAVSAPILLGALIPVEVICDQPGLGQLAWKAVAGRDLPLLTTLTLLFAAISSSFSLCAELFLPEAV